MFEWLFDFSIFGILRLAVFLAVGILLGVLIRHYLWRAKNQILYCREKDGRGLELDVAEEDAITLTTRTNPVLRFYKYGRAYQFLKRGRAFARRFGKEGTAYTWKLLGFSDTTKKPKKINLKFPTLEAAVVHKWGDKKYAEVPENLQKMLQDNQMLVTVGLEPGVTPKGYEPITESVIRKKSREDAKELIARGLKDAVSRDLFERLAYIGSGAGLVLIGMLLLGVIG